MQAHRHIGGSILPASSPEILAPINGGFGHLQVRVQPENDTHVLVLTQNDKETIIASHPNGYSCYELAKRIDGGTPNRIQDQAEYIIKCGGTALPTNVILALSKRPSGLPTKPI